MHVAPMQLIPGCVLIEDVKGKTNRPLIPKDTVITEEHINVLQKFLVESVNVSKRLNEGEAFIPKAIQDEKKTQPVESTVKGLSFAEHYQYVTQGYKKAFNQWQNGIAINMPAIRKLIIPLLERVESIGAAVYTLYHYVTKSGYIYDHAVAVAMLSAYLGKKMGYLKGEWQQIGLAGLLIDCGMARIDPSIIIKRSPLTEMEFNEVKKHPAYSYRMVEHTRTITQPVKLAVLQHHERMDGSGYPLGISRDKIHMYAKIVSVCDMYHAMTCERFYKDKQSPFKVIEEIHKEQFSKLDPQVVNLFIKGLSDYSIGTRIRLSNNETGEIVFVDSKNPSRPMVKMESNKEIIALQNKPDLFINEIIMG